MIQEEISANEQSRDPEKTSRDLFGVQLEVSVPHSGARDVGRDMRVSKDELH